MNWVEELDKKESYCGDTISPERFNHTVIEILYDHAR